MRTKRERIKQVELNMLEAKKLNSEGKMSDEQLTIVLADGRQCLREIRARKSSWYK